MNQIVEFKNVSKSFVTTKEITKVLDNLSFKINKGQIVSIVGPSGCGKSTLLNILAGLLEPETGSIQFENPNGLLKYPSIGYMLQKDELLPWRTILQNVILGLEINKLLTKENLDYVNALIKEYGLWDFKDKKPNELSGGMKQRAALIRTLSLKPEILLLDEPFSALDFQTRLIVSKDISSIIKKEHKTAILITHDISEAIRLSDKVIVLSQRPATLKNQITISLSQKGDSPLDYLEAPEYSSYFQKLWEDIKYEEI